MSVSGTLFHLSPLPVHCDTCDERKKFRRPVLQLTRFAKHVLCNRLKEIINDLRTKTFEDFAFDCVCATERCLPEIQHDDGYKITESTYQSIATLRDDEQIFYRPASENFPMVDFSTSCTKLLNAKSTKSS